MKSKPNFTKLWKTIFPIITLASPMAIISCANTTNNTTEANKTDNSDKNKNDEDTNNIVANSEIAKELNLYNEQINKFFKDAFAFGNKVNDNNKEHFQSQINDILGQIKQAKNQVLTIINEGLEKIEKANELKDKMDSQINWYLQSGQIIDFLNGTNQLTKSAEMWVESLTQHSEEGLVHTQEYQNLYNDYFRGQFDIYLFVWIYRVELLQSAIELQQQFYKDKLNDQQRKFIEDSKNKSQDIIKKFQEIKTKIDQAMQDNKKNLSNNDSFLKEIQVNEDLGKVIEETKNFTNQWKEQINSIIFEGRQIEHQNSFVYWETDSNSYFNLVDFQNEIPKEELDHLPFDWFKYKDFVQGFIKQDHNQFFSRYSYDNDLKVDHFLKSRLISQNQEVSKEIPLTVYKKEQNGTLPTLEDDFESDLYQKKLSKQLDTLKGDYIIKFSLSLQDIQNFLNFNGIQENQQFNEYLNNYLSDPAHANEAATLSQITSFSIIQSNFIPAVEKETLTLTPQILLKNKSYALAEELQLVNPDQFQKEYVILSKKGLNLDNITLSYFIGLTKEQYQELTKSNDSKTENIFPIKFA